MGWWCKADDVPHTHFSPFIPFWAPKAASGGSAIAGQNANVRALDASLLGVGGRRRNGRLGGHFS